MIPDTILGPIYSSLSVPLINDHFIEAGFTSRTVTNVIISNVKAFSLYSPNQIFPRSVRADIQRRGSIFTWIVILSLYGAAGTIVEVKLLISPYLR